LYQTKLNLLKNTLGTGVLLKKFDRNMSLLHIIASLPSFILIYQPHWNKWTQCFTATTINNIHK